MKGIVASYSKPDVILVQKCNGYTLMKDVNKIILLTVVTDWSLKQYHLLSVNDLLTWQHSHKSPQAQQSTYLMYA